MLTSELVRKSFFVVLVLVCIPSSVMYRRWFPLRIRMHGLKSFAFPAMHSLENIRSKAKNIALQFGDPLLPKKKIDAWRVIKPQNLFNYNSTPIGGHILQQYGSHISTSSSDVLHFNGSTATMVLVNNHFQDNLSNIQTLEEHNISMKIYYPGDSIPSDLQLMLFDLPEKETLPLRHRNDIIGSEYLAWHNLKELHCILTIDVPRNTKYVGSLEILHHFTQRDEHAVPPFSSRMIIRLGENATFSLVQHLGGSLDNSSSNEAVVMGHTTILMEPHSALNHTFSQDLPDSFNGFEVINASIRHSANYSLSSMLIGGNTYRLNAHATLKEPNALAEWLGVTLARGNRVLDFRGEMLHDNQATISNQNHRIILGNGGTGIYKSAILIPKIGQKSSAHQVCKSILVNNPCHINALPVLRTIADDIVCKHGVAVAELDEEELFYLLSRGLGQQNARMLLIQNFVFDLVPTAIKENKQYHTKIAEIIKSFDAETSVPTKL